MGDLYSDFIVCFYPQSALKVTHHAGHTLKHFCRWASLINPKSENHTNHHDIAVLITRCVCFCVERYSEMARAITRETRQKH